MMQPISSANAEHYTWGEACDGWHLLKRADLSVIEERVPAGGREAMHLHKLSRQFFYVLAGEAQLTLEDVRITLRAGEGLEVAPGAQHRLENNSGHELRLLVISMPLSHGDRVLIE